MSKNDRMVGISREHSSINRDRFSGAGCGGFSLPFTLRSAAATVRQGQRKSDLGLLFRQLW